MAAESAPLAILKQLNPSFWIFTQTHPVAFRLLLVDHCALYVAKFFSSLQDSRSQSQGQWCLILVLRRHHVPVPPDDDDDDDDDPVPPAHELPSEDPPDFRS